jgi:hypothetical protein
MRWIFPWIIKRHIKRMDNFMNDNREKHENNKTTYEKSATRKTKKRNYSSAEYIDFEEINDN